MLVNLLSEEDLESILGVSIYGLRSSCEYESIYKEIYHLGKKTVCTYEFYTKYPVRIPFGFKIEEKSRYALYNFYRISTEEVDMHKTFGVITTEY